MTVGLAKFKFDSRREDEERIGLRQKPVRSTIVDGPYLPRMSNYKISITEKFKERREEMAKKHFLKMERIRILGLIGKVREGSTEEEEVLEVVFEEEEVIEGVMKEVSGVMVTEEHEEMISNFVETEGASGEKKQREEISFKRRKKLKREKT